MFLSLWRSDGQPAWQASCRIRRTVPTTNWILTADNVTYHARHSWRSMMNACDVKGCKVEVPPALREHNLCVLHFTLSVENSCAGMRRETALGNAPHERQREIMKFISEHGEHLARVATSGLPLTDDLKARILSTFLTLMNLRENLDRANMRSGFGRSGQLR